MFIYSLVFFSYHNASGVLGFEFHYIVVYLHTGSEPEKMSYSYNITVNRKKYSDSTEVVHVQPVKAGRGTVTQLYWSMYGLKRQVEVQ